MFGGGRHTSNSNRSRGPIALDLGTSHVRMLQLAGTDDAPKVIAATQRVLPTGRPLKGQAYHDAVQEAITSMLDQTRFRGRRVVTALPAHVVHFKNLRLPKMPPAELAQAVEWEAAERLQVGDDQLQVQYLDAGEVRQGDEVREEVLLMAAPISFTEAHVKVLLNCGLTPLALDATPAALGRCLPDNDEGDDLNTPGRVIVDVGYTASKVVIVRGGRVLFFKLIEVGGQKLDERVAEDLNLSRDEAAEARQRQIPSAEDAAHPDSASATSLDTGRQDGVQRAVYEAVRPVITDLAREVSLCLRYYSVTFRGERPHEVSLVGGEAHQPALSALLAEGLGVPVNTLDPLAHADAGRWASVLESGPGRPAWATATGMALRHEAAASKRRAA